ncbi:MAG: hypothetical protein ACTSQP_06660 [Promethearchaeota archaeon]
MKIIEKGRKRISLKRKIFLIIIISIISATGIYLGVGIYIYLDLSSYNQDLGKYYWWDSEDCMYTGKRSFKNFYQERANWTFLEERAILFENLTDRYNICNESWDCATTLTEVYFEYGLPSPYYNNSWNYRKDLNDFLTNSSSKFRKMRAVQPIDGYGDSPIWTSNYIASLAFHYAVACEQGDANMANEILEKMERPVLGLHVLTHVSGLDGNLARFAIKDTIENRERFPWFFYDIDAETGKKTEKKFGRESNKYPGQGIYEGWWYQMRTSRDQHIGYFFGYSIAYKLLSKIRSPSGVNNALKNEILDMIAEDGSEVLDRLIGSNWHIINGEAEPSEGRGFDEASLHPRPPWTSGGDIMLAFLAFGKMVNPEKYESYYKKILNRFLSASYHFGADQSGSYFANHLAFDTMFQFYFIEGDPDIREFIRLHYNRDFYEYVQYHRNSLFNLGWLYINDYNLEDEILYNERLMYKLDDITDNLNRFARWRFPSRSWYIPKVADYDDLINPATKKYQKIFSEDSNHVLNILYGGLFREFTNTDPKSMIALGVDELGATDFIWQRSPFIMEGTHSDQETYSGYKQYAGVDYTLVYWMGRYFNYFK